MPVDVFHHHNGVVHQNADRKDQRKQRHAVEREAPGPGREQGGRQGQNHGGAHNHGLAPAQRKTDQQDDRTSGKRQFLNQFVGLFRRCFTVVAADGDFHVGRNHRVAQGVQPRTHGARHVHGVFARLFGHRQGDSGVDATGRGPGVGTARGVPHVALGQLRTGLNARHFAQVNRQALVNAHHEVAHILRRAQELSGFNGQHLGAGAGGVQHRARGHAQVGRRQGLLERHQIHTPFAQAHRVQPHLHGPAGPANGLHLARAGHALEFGLHRMGHLLQRHAGQRLAAPQRDAQHRHIVNAFGFDNRRQGAQVTRQPVLVGIEHVIQAHQGFGAGHANLELHGQQGQTGARHRVGVLNAGNLAQRLLGGPGHHVLHILAAGPRKGNQHIGHGHIDLGLFFTRGHQHGKQAHQQGHQRQQGREGIGLKSRGNAARNTHGWLVFHAHLTWQPAHPASPP